MGKRKISDYYGATKKRRGSATGKRYRSRVKGGLRKNRRFRKRLGRRPRRIRQKKTRNIKVTRGNLRNLTEQVADRVTVTTPAGTAGTPDSLGKACTWYYPGCNSSNFDYGLGCMYHIIQMSALIEQDEQGASFATTLAETEFMVKDSQSKYDFVNCSDAASKLSVYHCTVKRDVINTNSQYDFISMLGDGFYQRGVSQNGRGRGNGGVTDATLTPFHSHKFCSYVHVTKVETLILDPGQTITKFVNTGSYYVNSSHYTTQTAVGQTSATATLDYSHRRGEKFLFVKVEGQPANDATNRLSYTTPAIDVICTLSYTFQSINRQAPVITRLGAVNFSIPGTIQIMEDETGAVIPQANA